MRQAATCCFPEEDRESLPGDYLPIDPDGGCTGGQMTVAVRFEQCCQD